ncbi:MAG: class A beta-lactamase [Roseiarcus sp.]
MRLSSAQERRQGRSRRAFLLGAAACLAPIAARAASTVEGAREKIIAIEAREGGRLGVAILDTGAGATLGYRDDERFPMCSTFKLLAAAAVLKRVDAGAERLDRRIAHAAADLLDYAPVAKAHLAEGGMSVGDLCAAAIDWSDNTAANLILQSIGGPAGFTQFARSLGDSVTRLDRIELELNASIPGDERDTTSPRAMLHDMRAALLGDALGEASRRRLESWLVDDRVGDMRLRAGLPPSWRVGDKTGSGDNGSANAIAIIRPPGRAPLLAAVYFTGSTASMDARNAVHKEIGALIAETF